MKKLDINCFATLKFEIKWNSPRAAHQELYLAQKVNLWRDIFPPGMKDALMGLEKDQTLSDRYSPGQAVPARSTTDIIKTDLNHFTSRKFLGRPVIPRPGRFYPRGMLGGVRFFPEESRPCRIISINDGVITSDLAHPLVDYTLDVSATVLDLAEKDCEKGGRLTHWMEEILGSGPGMQAWTGENPKAYLSPGAFDRADESDDSAFYKAPRFVEHIDSRALSFLEREYARRLKPGMEILDLMSSVNSHLPSDLDVRVTGLGLNQAEMDANPRLRTSIVHDLNQSPDMLLDDNSFDAVLCSLSIEYSVHPYQLAREAARVLRPGGLFVVAFSNRWFPAKVISLWQELHEFERMRFVTDLMLKTGSLEEIETVSIRNWRRPGDDPHFGRTPISDPVYLVSGRKR